MASSATAPPKNENARKHGLPDVLRGSGGPIRPFAYGGALPVFGDLTTWRPWLDFLRAVYGLRLDAEGEVRFCHHTGRTVYDPPEGGWREIACIVGRQSGKTRVASLLAAYEAAMAQRCRDGELYALLLAQDWRASIRASFSYCRVLLDASPILRREVIRQTADTIDLANGVRLATYPCRPASVRGLRARVAILDELAFFRSREGAAVDAEMLTAIRPALATTGGKLVIISSPYGSPARSGIRTAVTTVEMMPIHSSGRRRPPR